MPYHDPEPGDPHVLVGVGLPAGPQTQRAMAQTFAEEFARMGFDEQRILALFRQPFYAGAHGALDALGEDEITRLVAASVAVWGRSRTGIRDAVEPLRQHAAAGSAAREAPCPP